MVSTHANDCLLEGRAADCLCEVRNETSDWILRSGGLARLHAGLELVLNLLALDAHDRYFVLPEGRPRLNWSGEVRGECIALVDEWLNLRITCE